MKESNQSTLARLLATENISVVQDNVRTASFDVKNRVLTLPVWSEVEKYVEDHLVGHEVGHALFTPLDGWHDAVCDRGFAYKSFLNVVEDARIEKLIQRKYPGLRSSFVRSYRHLLAEGFFGANLDQINQMGLIDRINTYFKCGQSAGVKFSAEEQQWLPRIDSLETWDEVTELTDELFAFCKEQQEEQRRQEQESQDADEQDEDDEESDWGEEDGGEVSATSEDQEEFESEDSDTDEDADEFDRLWNDEESSADSDDDDSDDLGEEGGKSNGQTFDPSEDLESVTDKNLRDSIDREINSNFDGQVNNYSLPESNNDHLFVSYKEVLADMRGEKLIGSSSDYGMSEHYLEQLKKDYVTVLEIGGQMYRNWLKNNQRGIKLMAKEFEMRKSAAQYSRASVSKTGVLDTVKMNNYKISDDIFKRVTITPEGKNHGFIMVLDLSGSMMNTLYNVVGQVLMMTHFCRQIGVPFRVYGFTDYLTDRIGQERDESEYDNIYADQELRMIEIFNEKMSKPDLFEMASALLASVIRYGNIRDIRNDNPGVDLWKLDRYCTTPRVFALGGTPLDSSIVALIPQAMKFRSQHRLDVLNTIFLTDGASHGLQTGRGWALRDPRTYNMLQTIRCEYNNKTYKYRQLPTRMMNTTEVLMNIYKDITGSRMLGYYVDCRGRQGLMYTAEGLTGTRMKDWSEKWSEARKGHVTLAVEGYDEFFLVPAIALKRVESKMEKMEAGASKAKLRSAFKSTAVGSIQNRKMLADIVKWVA